MPIDILISEAFQLFHRRLRMRDILERAGFVFRERSKSRFNGILSLEHIDRIGVPYLNKSLEMGRFET
jgi:hypothetical protein